MIIYGTWPLRMKMGQDAQAKTQCPNYHQIAHWDIFRVLRFFTLFFIPFIPYRLQYFMICPSCDGAVKIKKSEARERLAGDGAIEATASVPQTDENDRNRAPAIRHEPFLLPTEQIVQMEKKMMRKRN